MSKGTPETKYVGMEVMIFPAKDGSIHVTSDRRNNDGSRTFHSHVTDKDNIHKHFKRVLQEEGRWPYGG